MCCSVLRRSVMFDYSHPMDYQAPLSMGILQARILEWVAFPFSSGIFPTQGSNPDLQHCRRILYQLSHRGSPRILDCIAYPFSRGSSQPRNQTGVSCLLKEYIMLITSFLWFQHNLLSVLALMQITI